MSQLPSDAIESALVVLEADEGQILGLWLRMVQAYGGALYGFDFLAGAALNRSLALSSGFRVMIRERNLICAGALVRLQLDTALRFFAGFTVSEPHDFALVVLEGERIDKMKDRHGKRMTDRHLVSQLTKEYPWVEAVYEGGSGYVHLSATHIFSTFDRKYYEEEAKHRIRISSRDQEFPDGVYLETIKTFRQCTNILKNYIEGWIITKENPPNRAD